QGIISPSDFLLPLSLGLLFPLALLLLPWTANRPLGQLIASVFIIIGIFYMGHLVFTAAQGLALI
ncbi:MAG: hypothetical protein ACP5Q3_17055, partial [bacterium]